MGLVQIKSFCHFWFCPAEGPCNEENQLKKINIMVVCIRGSAESKSLGSLWTPELIENGKVGVPKEILGSQPG